MAKVSKTEDQWRQQLTPEEFRITRQAGTEPAFTGIYWNTKTPGAYHCKCCDALLFQSDSKYDSGSGWPSFHSPVTPEVVATKEDLSLGMRRIEVLCAACDAHLGHVFPDGPAPRGLRYCLNSASLSLAEEGAQAASG